MGQVVERFSLDAYWIGTSGSSSVCGDNLAVQKLDFKCTSGRRIEGRDGLRRTPPVLYFVLGFHTIFQVAANHTSTLDLQ